MSKQSKGSEFERKICKRLSLWWTNGERDDVFWRTAGSGAMATQRTKKSKRTFGQYGDIQAIDPIGQPLLNYTTIELKRGYGTWGVLDVLDKSEKNATQEIEKFIEQAEADRIEAEVPYFMLITKRDRRVPVIFIPRQFYFFIEETCGKFKKDFADYCPVILRFKIHYIFDDYIIAFRLVEFLKWCRPEAFLITKRRKVK